MVMPVLWRVSDEAAMKLINKIAKALGSAPKYEIYDLQTGDSISPGRIWSQKEALKEAELMNMAVWGQFCEGGGPASHVDVREVK